MNSIYTEFLDILESKTNEEEVHQFLASHTYLLQDLGYGVKRIFSKPTFGSDFKADFALAGWGNYVVWTFVEIEAPHHPLFTKAGLVSQGLNKAIEQVNSWWIWMYDYGDYAGAHYHDLSGDKTAAIVIGRRKSLRAVDIRRLKQMNESQLGGRLRIVTYDALLDKLKSLTQRGVEALEEEHLELTKYRTVRDWGAADYI